MKTRVTLAVAIGLIGFGTSLVHGQSPTGTTGTSPAALASASLVDTQGRGIGQAYLQQTPQGVLLKLELNKATPGIHALHVHDTGRCDRPSFESTGGHFNPGNREHGFLNPRGPHAGDLPNLAVPSSTELSVEYFLADVTIDPGPRSLVDGNGSAIVIHTGKDDYSTDPAGAAGARLACGAIVRAHAG